MERARKCYERTGGLTDRGVAETLQLAATDVSLLKNQYSSLETKTLLYLITIQ
jgi:hypothetical protein